MLEFLLLENEKPILHFELHHGPLTFTYGESFDSRHRLFTPHKTIEERSTGKETNKQTNKSTIQNTDEYAQHYSLYTLRVYACASVS